MARYRINDFSIDWLSPESHYFFDPKHPEKNALKSLAKKFPFRAGHICLFTSGAAKAVFISKTAALFAAKASNLHLQCEGKNKLWLSPLPLFHVGGLAPLCRAFAGEYSFLHWKTPWNAAAFQKALKEKQASYTSLVPLQVYDLIQAKIPPPPALEFALVGGGFLSLDLWKKSKALGWPLLPTYGMTEAFSQIATAERSSLKSPDYPALKLLPHMEARIKEGSAIEIRSRALFTGYYERGHGLWKDPKTKDGWFRTQDQGALKGRNLKIHGRSDEAVKISGRLIYPSSLSAKVSDLAQEAAPYNRFFIRAFPDARKTHSLALITDCWKPDVISFVLKRFNASVPHFQKLRTVYIMERFSKSGLKPLPSAGLKKALSL